MNKIQQREEFERMYKEAIDSAGFLARKGLQAQKESIWKLFEKHTALTYQKAYCQGQ